MKNILLTTLFVAAFLPGKSQQQFISKGKIEFEVRCNIYAHLGDNMWDQNAKDKLPKFSVNYFDYIFSENNKSIYKFNRTANTQKIPSWYDIGSEDNVWYNDYTAGTFSDVKEMWGDDYNLKDSIPVIEWKITNEHRTIAGFDCKKAFGKIFDSVYVFAFYTDEILISGGPMHLSGLPGMILGVTIPRMHTSWIATGLQVNNVDEKKIAPPSKGKINKASDVQKKIGERMKDWGNRDDWFAWRMFI